MREREIDPSKHTVYGSIEEFEAADAHPAGVLTVMYGGIPVDLRYDPRGFGTTLVFFHAAVSRDTKTLPLFLGASLSRDFAADRIFFSDPTLLLDSQLTLGWHAGNHRQPELQSIVTRILARLIGRDQRVVMYGGSAGGFAAMHYAAQIPNALAVPMNPQIRIADFYPSLVKEWVELGWGHDPAVVAVGDLPVVTDAGDPYRRGDQTPVWYVQNTGDTRHMDGHYTPFMASLPEGHRVTPVLVDAGPGHVRPDKEVLVAILTAAIEGREAPPAVA